MTVDEAMNLALAHHQAGRLAQAEALYRQVLATLPNHPGALHFLGVLAHQVGRQDLAADLIRRSIQVLPTAAAYSNLGEALRESGRTEEAIGCYRRAIDLDPQMASAYSNLGLALQTLRRFADAEPALRRAIELEPDAPAAHQNLCNTLGDLGKTAEAVTEGRRAVQLQPGSPSAWSDLGVACVENGDLEQAKEAFERAVALDPDRADAHHNFGQALLRLGEFERGWDQYEWRWRCKDFPSPVRQFGQSLWNGEDLTGRRVLLHAEQGLGDAIMFARYVPMVVDRGASRVIVECQPEIADLIRSVADRIDVIPRGQALPEFDLHCPFLSLPRAFKTTVATVPNRVPYLSADPQKAANWRSQLSARGPELNVGVVWAGRPTHKNDHNRSAPAARFAGLAMDGVRLFSLQVGERARDVNGLQGIVDLSPNLTDYSQTAAVLSALDLVIAVDTSVVHAAGALAREVWVLLPFAGDWRWIGRRPDSPWYPTMRLFRQDRWGDWETLFQRVRAELRTRMTKDEMAGGRG